MNLQRKKEKKKKTAKKKTKKENLFCNPFRKTQTMIILQYLEPAHFDKMSLFQGKGEIFSQKRQMKVILSFNIKDLYRLQTLNKIHQGTITSREATPLGDPRGVPKKFPTFWSFSKQCFKNRSKCKIKSLPICLEGFGNRTEQQSNCDAQLFEIDSALRVVVCKTLEKTITFHLDLKMEAKDHPVLDQLFDLINQTDFNFISENENNLNVDHFLSESTENRSQVPDTESLLQTNPGTFTEPQPTLVETLDFSQQEEFVIDSEISNEIFVQAAQESVCVPQYTVTVPQPTASTILPQIFVQIPGTNQFQLAPVSIINAQPNVQVSIKSDNPSGSPSRLVSPNATSSSLSSPSPLLHTNEEYLEMRRKNNKACEEYRKRKKTKQEQLNDELEELEKKNQLLQMKVRSMESMIKELRSKVITGITNPQDRGLKRRSETTILEQENKRWRWEP